MDCGGLIDTFFVSRGLVLSEMRDVIPCFRSSTAELREADEQVRAN